MKRKIIAFAGSNSLQSINRQLVKYTLESLDEYEIHLLDLNDFEMPIYSYDREKNGGIPQLAHDFRKLMHEADGIVISLAEHNGNFSVAIKNIQDWCSRVDMNIFNEKPMLLMSTSGGRLGGARVMEKAVEFYPYFKANIIETFSLTSFYHTFADGNIIDDNLKNQHTAKLEAFKKSLGMV
ncbi:MAG: NADPH-dependent FMN reductase [Paludibacteraceae bacterium]